LRLKVIQDQVVKLVDYKYSQISRSLIPRPSSFGIHPTTMSPAIPSPTPIVGVRNPDGSPRKGQRLALAELQKNDFAFALYTQALLAWQKDGDEDKDSDNATGTSYFQVTGMLLFVQALVTRTQWTQVFMAYLMLVGKTTTSSRNR